MPTDTGPATGLTPATTVPTAPDGGRRRPSVPRRLQVGLLVAAILFAAVALAGQLIHHDARLGGRFAGVRTIEVDNDAGDVTVRAATGSGVAVSAYREWSFRGPTATMALRNGVLRLVGSCPGGLGSGRCGVTWTVTAPAGVEIRVRSSNGDVTATGATGRLLLHSDVGRMEALNVGSARIEVSTDAGSVKVTARTAPTLLVAHTGGGDVQVTAPPGPYRLTTTAEHGITTVRVPNDPAATRTLSATTDRGDVLVD